MKQGEYRRGLMRDVIQAARQIQNDIVSFLETLDGLMQEAGWVQAAKKNVSLYVIYPVWYRMYAPLAPEKRSDRFIALHVELEQIKPADDVGCLIAAARFAEPREYASVWNAWLDRDGSIPAVRFAAASPGLWMITPKEITEQGFLPGAVEVRSVWLPLHELTDASQLVSRIVDPAISPANGGIRAS